MYFGVAAIALIQCRSFDASSAGATYAGTTSGPADAGAAGATSSSAGGGGDAPSESNADGGARDSDVMAPVSPDKLQNVVLWLDAGQGVELKDGGAQKVSVWRDRSPFGNDAAQVDDESKPNWVRNQLNALPAVAFDGLATRLDVADSASLAFSAAPFTMAVVGAWTNSTLVVSGEEVGYAHIICKVGAFAPFSGPCMMANFPSFTAESESRLAMQIDSVTNAISSMSGLNDGRPRLYVAQRATPSELRLRINGVLVGRTTVADWRDATSGGNALYIGGQYPPYALEGKLAEIVIIRGALDDTALNGLEEHLIEKYGLDRTVF